MAFQVKIEPETSAGGGTALTSSMFTGSLIVRAEGVVIGVNPTRVLNPEGLSGV